MELTEYKSRMMSLNQANREYENSNFSFFKGITTISVALVGLLIGLKPSSIPNQCAKMLFLTTIILIGLCILCSLIVQFYEVLFYKKKVYAREKILKEYKVSVSDTDFLEVLIIKRFLFFEFFQILTFLFLLLSIITLILYVYFSEFY